jgi:hypothetical protein
MIKKIVLFFILFCFVSTLVFASSIQQCGSDSEISGLVLKVAGNSINVRVGPGMEFERVINKKASKILKKTQYVSIDESVTVIEECRKKGWSKIRVIDPDYLSESHRGWVATKFLIKPKNIEYKGNWYSDWISESNLGIEKSLVANNIRGCGEYRFRKNMTDNNDFLVKCTADGKNWVLYRVSTSKNKVEKLK